MAATESLRTHLIEELTDLLDAENQLTKALPKMAGSASSRQLRAAFNNHLRETRGHITRLNQALRLLGEEPDSKTCEAMEGLLEEGESMMNKTPAGALRDAVMITGAQKVEHYEMASYGTVRTYAQVLGEQEVARLLHQTLKEEKTADRTLTQIAESSINQKATAEWEAEEQGMLQKTAEWAGTTASYASKQMSKGIRYAASAVGMANERSGGRSSSGRRRSTGRRSTSSRRRTGTKKR